jgi:transcriptional regulator, DeoR family
MCAKLSAKERQAQILTLLSENGTMKAVDLAEHFQVSRETIRRDLIAMNKEGSISKMFGGAVPVHDFHIQPVLSRIVHETEEKQRISERALDFLVESSVIFIGTGSTTLCFANLLKNHGKLTVITNSLPAINALAGSAHRIITTGGTVNHSIMSVTGTQTLAFLEQIKVDTAFLGTSGFDRHKGPTGNDLDDNQIKRVVIDNARRVIVLADSKKATHSSLAQYASWREIDCLITDDKIPSETKRQLEELTSLIIA